MSNAFNRRDFLAYSGASIAGLTLGEAGRRWLARADARAATWQPAGVETSAASVCRECPAGCGTRVRLVNDTPVKIDGNPLCPLSRGRLCAKGQAALESYFDPDRLTGPARRSGPRGSGKWDRISWTDASLLLASRIEAARGGGGRVVAFSADERGPIDAAWAGFWTGVHARIARTLPASAERLAPRFAALTGAAGDPVFEVERATAVLSFGAPVVEDWLSPMWAQRSYGHFRRGPSRARGRLVQVEGRRSLTARKADEWLPVATDRQPFLAYGIASVLLRESRVDRASIAEFGGNLAAFENTVVAQFTPDAVAAASGVPVVTLLRLARDLIATPHPLVVVAADAPAELVDAVFALNALIGAFDRAGGVFETPPHDDRGPEEITAKAALADLQADHGASIAAFRDASALRDLAAPPDLGATFDKCGLVVSFSPYLDETAAVADLLLPTNTPLESWHGVVPPTADGSEKLACAKPAVTPRLDTRDLIAALRMTADRLHIPVPCPATSAAAVEGELERLWRLRRGAPYTGTFQTEWTLELERGGWWVPPARSPQEFSRVVLEAGGWVDPYFAPGQLRQSIAHHGGLRFAPPAAHLEAASIETPRVVFASRTDGDRIAPVPGALELVTFTPAAVNLTGGPNQPVLFELLGQPDSAPWRPWAELNPETARQLNVAHGATVRVRSSAGAIDVVALLADRTPPNTVAVAFVPALSSGGRWARFITADVRRLWGAGATPGEPLAVTVTPA